MGGTRRRGVAGLCLLSACVFDTGSTGGASMLEDTDASTSATPSAATGATAGASGDMSGGSQSGTEGSSSAAASSDDETTTAIDPSEGNPPRADLVFVDVGPVDLGVHALSGPTRLTLQLTNEGDAAASILGGEDPPSPLLWAGDAFPGTDATCQGLLPPGGTCTVTLAVGPGQPGLISGPVAVRFDDAVGTGTASVPVDLTATGQGPNLIENADAESDPEGAILTGWDAEDSSFHTSAQHNHGEGSLSFYGGDSDSPEMSQDLVLTPWSDSIDNLGLRFAFTGWTRARDNFWGDDDPHGISLTFLDGFGGPLDAANRSGMAHDGWESTNFDVPVPEGTRRVRIRLTCDRNDGLLGDSCSAWFDDLFGALVYAPK